MLQSRFTLYEETGRGDESVAGQRRRGRREGESKRVMPKSQTRRLCSQPVSQSIRSKEELACEINVAEYLTDTCTLDKIPWKIHRM